MKIRNRLALFSSLIFGLVFLITSTAVYFLFNSSSEKIILNELEKASVLTSMYYLEEDELPQKEHSVIKKQFQNNLQNTQVRIYDASNKVKFGNKEKDTTINTTLLDAIRSQKKLHFESETNYYFGIFYPDNQGDFVIIIKNNKDFFKSQSNQLLLILMVVLAVGLLLVILLSHWLSSIAYRPIRKVIDQVNFMEINNLDQPVTSDNTNDEIQDLIETYNNLLRRIADNFIIQKNFINYVSHEFKTPLAAISGNLEVFAQKERTQQEYEQVVKEALDNVYYIEKILNSLMLVSGFKTPGKEKESFRIDELLWNITDQMAKSPAGANTKIQIHFEVKNESSLMVGGNEIQIQLAIANLIENALKYSNNKPIAIKLSDTDNQIKIVIRDYGKGISEEDLEHVQKPFFRGQNIQDTKGSGVGLSLATIILKQNHIEFSISSQVAEGTLVELLFSKL